MTTLLWTLLGALTFAVLCCLVGAGLAAWVKRRFPDHDEEDTP